MAKKFHRDVWVGTVLLIFCITVFFTAVQIPGQASYLPITLSLLMGLCSVFIILKGLRCSFSRKMQNVFASFAKTYFKNRKRTF